MYKNSDIKFITIYYNSKIISKKKKNEKTIEIKKKKLSSYSSILITHEKKKISMQTWRNKIRVVHEISNYPPALLFSR